MATAVPFPRNVVGVLDEATEGHVGVGNVQPVVRGQRVLELEDRADGAGGPETREMTLFIVREKMTSDLDEIRHRGCHQGAIGGPRRFAGGNREVVVTALDVLHRVVQEELGPAVFEPIFECLDEFRE